jgi:photosystem II stability/assembly factor-like uncharacterized protein
LFMTSTLGYLPVQALAPDDNFYLLIYRSDDSGETWTFKNSVMDGEVFDFFNLDEGWLVASNGLFQTVDGGANWSLVPTVGIPAGEYFLNVDFVDSLHGWVLTTPDDYTRDPLNFYRTVDGGASWEQLLP